MAVREGVGSYLALVVTAVFCAGCGSVSTYGPPPGAVNPVETGRSLIPADAAMLSDGDIARILAVKVEVPQQIRVAVLYLAHGQPGTRSWWERVRADEMRFAMGPVQKLRGDKRVYDVSFLPSFLLPAEKSIPLIREAAARYQADWVLIVQSEARNYAKDRVIGKDEARAYCEAECVVLDVRTGTIPFTSVATGDATVLKSEGDYSLDETSLRAEGAAVELAMAENVDNLLKFLGRIE